MCNNWFLSNRFWLLSLFLMAFSAQSFGQCVPVGVSPNKDGVTIMGLWSDEGSSEPEDFTGYFQLKSEGDATYQLSITALTDPESSTSVSTSAITISPAEIQLEAGKTTEIEVVISGIKAAGHFTGMLQISQVVEEGDCFRELPFELDIKVPGQAMIVESDQALSIKTVEKSMLIGLLPTNIRQEGIFVRVENAGPTSISFSDFSLSLKGNTTNHPVSKTDVKWENPDEVIPSGGIAMMKFLFTNPAQRALEADEYSGTIRLHVKNYPTTLSSSITMYARTGVMGAIIALLLGIFVGRMLKSVNQAGDQIELMKRYVPLRASIDNVREEPSKKALLAEANELEKQINKVTGPEERAAVEQLFPSLETKTVQIHDLVDTYGRLAQQFVAKKVRKENQQPVVDQVNRVRDAILAGDQIEVKAGWAAIRANAEKALEGERSRSLGDDSSKTIDPDVMAELGAIERMIEKNQKDGSSTEEIALTEPFLKKLERWFFKIFGLLGGVQVNARIRFGLFRPIVAMITFLVVVLIGFQEIYINGGDTFGAEGVYDHLKLFVWGIVSDVFSRTLTDEKSMNTFSRFVPGA